MSACTFQPMDFACNLIALLYIWLSVMHKGGFLCLKINTNPWQGSDFLELDMR